MVKNRQESPTQLLRVGNVSSYFRVIIQAALSNVFDLQEHLP
jgi:hypothetical protein